MEKKNEILKLENKNKNEITDDYHTNPKTREMRCLNSPNSLKVQDYLRSIGLLPTIE